jgi:hypothetical protein
MSFKEELKKNPQIAGIAVLFPESEVLMLDYEYRGQVEVRCFGQCIGSQRGVIGNT